MSDQVVFPLFGDGGFVNPIPHPRFELGFYDSNTVSWRNKQSRDFDGGWRWFDKYDAAALVIYNTKMHKQACTLITHREIEDSCVGPEFVLLCAQSRVMVDHLFFSAREQVQDHIRALVKRARKEIFGDPGIRVVR